jgi:hypothetical protein
VEEGAPDVGWYERAFPAALAAGRPEVEYEVESVVFIIGLGNKVETGVDMLLTLVSEPLAESESVTTS